MEPWLKVCWILWIDVCIVVCVVGVDYAMRDACQVRVTCSRVISDAIWHWEGRHFTEGTVYFRRRYKQQYVSVLIESMAGLANQ